MQALVAACKRTGHSNHVAGEFQSLLNSNVKPSLREYVDCIFACQKHGDPTGCVFWFQKLKQARYKPSKIMVEAIISAFCKRRKITREGDDLQIACNWLQDMQRCRVQPDNQTYNVILGSFLKSNRQVEAVEFFEPMPKDVYSFSLMIEHWLRQEDEETATGLLEKMIATKVQPNVRTYSSFLHFCARKGDADGAESWFELLKSYDIVPNIHAFNSVLAAHGRSQTNTNDEPFSAIVEKYFAQMQELSCHLESITYTTILDGFAKRNDLENCEFYFNKMLQASVKVDNCVYNTLLVLAVNLGNSEKALGWFEQMVRSGISPDLANFSTLLASYGKDDSVVLPNDFVERWVGRMWKAGCPPDIGAYISLISVYAQRGDVEKVNQIFDMMKSDSIEPNLIVLNTRLSVYAKANDPESAKKCFEEDFQDVTPSIVTYSILADACARVGDPVGVFHWLTEMKKQRIEPNLNFKNSVLTAYSKQGKVLKAVEYLVEHIPEPNTQSHKSILQGFAVQGDGHGALGWMERADKEFGQEPTLEIWNSVLDSFAKTGDVDNARMVFDRILAAGVTPSLITVNILLDAHGQNGDYQGAVDSFKRFFGDIESKTSEHNVYDSDETQATPSESIFTNSKDGDLLKPDLLSFMAVVTSAAHCGDDKNAEAWVGKMKKAGFDPDLRLYTTVMNLFNKRGNTEIAARWYEKMEAMGLDKYSRHYGLGGPALRGILNSRSK